MAYAIAASMRASCGGTPFILLFYWLIGGLFFFSWLGLYSVGLEFLGLQKLYLTSTRPCSSRCLRWPSVALMVILSASAMTLVLTPPLRCRRKAKTSSSGFLSGATFGFW